METTQQTMTTVSVTGMPIIDLDYLRPHAVRDGHNATDASTTRWAVIELAKRLRRERTDDT